MSIAATVSARPPIILGATDAERLSALALQAEQSLPLAAGLLLDELDRAEVRPDKLMPSNVVRIGSFVDFIDEAHDQPRTVQLVYPAEADIEAGRISVLTPVGAGLIGLSPGQAILWPDRDGHQRTLRILAVRPPEGG